MKKALPIILLIFGGILACGIGLILGGLLLAAALVLGTEVLRTVILPAVILSLVIGGHVVGAVFLQRLYQRRWRIGKAIFWICAGLPSVLIGSFSIILFSYSRRMGIFPDLSAGCSSFCVTLHVRVFRRVLRGSGISPADNSCCFSHQKSEIARKNLNLTEFVI